MNGSTGARAGRARGALAIGAAVVLLAGCARTDPDPVVTFDDDAPLEALPACEAPEGHDAVAPPGLLPPEGAVFAEVAELEVLTQVRGYVERTPRQVRAEYEEREDLILIFSEDEVIESELLVSDGRHRTYVKASAVCATGSNLHLVLAPELEADALPVPPGRAPE